MKLSTKVTKDTFRTHLTYNAWKYAILAVVSIFGWNLIFTTTAYRSPADKRIDVYIKSGTADQTMTDAFLKTVWEEATPEVETVTGVIMTASGADDYYSNMQLTVYFAAQEGDIFILPTEEFKQYASQGVFASLDEAVSDGTLNIDGIDVTSGYVTYQDGDGTEESPYISETHLYGVPAYSLYAYMDGMQLDNRDLVMAIYVANGNDASVFPFFNAFVQAGRGDMPQWLAETVQEEPAAE